MTLSALAVLAAALLLACDSSTPSLGPALVPADARPGGLVRVGEALWRRV